MEKIISILIIFGLTSLYEYIKQMRKKRAESQRAEFQARRRPAPVAAGMAAPFSTEVREPNTVMRHENHAERPRRETPKDNHKTFLSGENVTIPLVVDDEKPIEIVDLDANDSSVGTAVTSSGSVDHYERWRQAIIDAEIITPKFK